MSGHRVPQHIFSSALAMVIWTGVSVASASEPQKVAVLDMKAVGLDAAKAQALQTTLGSVLTAETARLGLHVISMADIAAMLAFEKKRDLLGCDETSCLAEIGGALGADLMLTSSIGLVGGSYTISLTLVDIRKAEVRQRFVGNAGSEAVLGATVTRGVGVLFGAQQDTSAMGTIFVKTTPPGATISLDGKKIGVSPRAIDEVPAGDHLVVAALGERRVERIVRVEPESVNRLDLTLAESPPVKLMVNSEPPEAKVFVNGEAKGVTPLMLAAVPSGTISLRLEIEHYEPYETRLELSFAQYEQSGRQAFRHTAKLKAHPVTLELTGLPEGAMATLDGKSIGPETRLPPGRYDLRATAPGYQTLEQELVLEPGKDRVVPLAMTPTAAQTEYLGARASRQTTFFISFVATGVLAVVSAGAFVGSELSRASSDRLHDRYLGATDQADMNQDYQDAVKDMKRARRLRTLGLAAGGTALAAAALSTYFRLTYPVGPRVEVGAAPSSAGAGVWLRMGLQP